MAKRIFTSFIVLLIVAKIGYLLFEMYYNGSMLDTVTAQNATKEGFEHIESLGHNLTSLGLTLLFAPLFYWGVRKITLTQRQTPVRVGVFLLLCVLFYSQVYSGLAKFMDYLVESQKDKRYIAYYVNSLKYGIISGKLGYSTFIPKKEENQNLTIKEKVLLANIFLLTHIDKTLIERLIADGTEGLIDVAIYQHYGKEYVQAKEQFNKTIDQISHAWERYQKAQNDINIVISQKNNQNELVRSYEEMKKKLDSKYAVYKRGSDDYYNRLNNLNGDTNRLYNDLSRYFLYRWNTKAEQKYEATMKSQFGRPINPETWCSGNTCPSKDAIKKFLKSELDNFFYAKSEGVSPGLNKNAFLEQPSIKKKVIEDLGDKGLYIDKSFDYSPQMFQQAYESSINKTKREKIEAIKTTFEKEGAINIRESMNKTDFIEAFAQKIESEITIADNQSKKRILELIKKGDKDSFYEYVYRPYFKKEVASKYILQESDFERPDKKSLGDGAIKMLFIPPFAIAMSLLAGSLNFVTLIALLLTLRVVALRTKLIAKTGIILLLMVLIIYLPYKKGIDDDILKEHVAIKAKNLEKPWGDYFHALHWIVIAESYNYEYVYMPIKKLLDTFQTVESLKNQNKSTLQ